jgi:hypothetical membrane protein
MTRAGIGEEIRETARTTPAAGTAVVGPRPTTDRLAGWLLAGGVAGPLLFIVVFLIEGATRPGYSVWRNYVSDLSLSDQGWEQISNFLVCGALVIGLAVAFGRLWRTGPAATWGPRLVGAFGVGLLVAGTFSIDPGRGYPAGAPLTGNPHTLHAYVHGINGMVVFNVLVIACFVLGRRFALEPGSAGWARYCRITGTLVLLLEVLGTVSSSLAENGVFTSPTGLIQRAEIILGWTWLALTALRLLRQQPGDDRDGQRHP